MKNKQGVSDLKAKRGSKRMQLTTRAPLSIPVTITTLSERLLIAVVAAGSDSFSASGDRVDGLGSILLRTISRVPIAEP